MGFIQDLINRFTGDKKAEPERVRGSAPRQSDAEQSASRNRMEAEMADQKSQRESSAEQRSNAPKEEQP